MVVIAMHKQVSNVVAGDAEPVGMLCLQEQSIRVNCTTLSMAPSEYLESCLSFHWASELLLAL